MSRSWILAPAILALLISSLGISERAHAQVPYPFLAMSVRADSPGNTCYNAPPPCEGEPWVPTTGRYEFDVYRTDNWSGMPTDAARFSLHWPAAWTFVSAEICTGTLVSGDLSVRGSHLEFSFPDCPPTETPFLRMVLDCSTPGSFFAANSPSVKACGLAHWEEDILVLQCDVGDWCGRLPFRPCDWCSQRYGHAASFDPTSYELTLLQGESWTGLTHAHGDRGPYCGGAPECGWSYGACFAALETDVPWMTLDVYWPEGEGYQTVPFSLHVDTEGLTPGRYEGNVVARGGCSWCKRCCMPVTLIVQDPAAVDGSSSAQATRLDGPYPNPSAERFDYAVTVAVPTRARVTMLDVAGRRVAELLDRDLPAGTHTFSYSRSDEGLASGSYILRLDAGSVRQSRLIVLTR